MARASLLLVAVISMLPYATPAHVFYSAIGGKDGPGVGYGDISNSLVWGKWNEVGDVFASNEFFFENGQIGYMGGQLHADGSHSVIFSIWDQCVRYGSTTCIVPNATALPAGKGCLRFGGEGHGAHCGFTLDPPGFVPGRPYHFKVKLGAPNATGQLVTATVDDKPIGAIFLNNTDDPKDGTSYQGYGRFAPYCRTFMEYWSGGQQAHSFGWIGPYAEGSLGPPVSAVADSAEGLPVKISACIPSHGCGRGQVFYNASTALKASFPERVDGGYWVDLWKPDPRLQQRNMEACAWSKDTGLAGNAQFFC